MQLLFFTLIFLRKKYVDPIVMPRTNISKINHVLTLIRKRVIGLDSTILELNNPIRVEIWSPITPRVANTYEKRSRENESKKKFLLNNVSNNCPQ